MRSADRLCRGLTLLLALGASRAADAQVWLPDRGDAVVSVSYQQLFSRDHLDSEGRRYDKGQISNLALNTGLEYGLSDLFALDANLTVAAAKHEGADRLHGPLDTGIYHGVIQDARVALRFRVPRSPGGFALTPYVGGILPTHDYETRGHSAPGRHLRALQLGMGAGRGLGPALPNGHVQGMYSYSLVERVGGMSINRSNIEIEGGYAVRSFMTVTLSAAVQRTHGGILAPVSHHYHGEAFAAIQPIHDRITRANFFLMSSGATVALTRKVSLHGSFIWTVSGQNTHAVKGFVLGTSWAFMRGLTLGAP